MSMESSRCLQGIRGPWERAVSSGDGCKGNGPPGELVSGLERRLWGGDHGGWLSRTLIKLYRPQCVPASPLVLDALH